MTGGEDTDREGERDDEERKSTCLFSADACRIVLSSCPGSSAFYISGSSSERGRGGRGQGELLTWLQYAVRCMRLCFTEWKRFPTISRSLLSLLIVICMHVSGVLSPSCQPPSGTARSVACIFCGRHACRRTHKDYLRRVDPHFRCF